MLWLTWRQHRAQAAVTVLLLAVVAVLLAVDEMPVDVVKTLPWTPVLVGLFWGVPLLVREFERGTDRLAWTQSVPRTRWLAVKFASVAAAVVVAGLAFGAVVDRWLSGAAAPMDRFSGDLFGVTGILPAAWFLAVFALGAASGAVLRRTLPAMAVTIAVFAVLVVGAFLARGHYAEPVVVSPVAGGTVPADALVVELAGLDGDHTSFHPADRYWRFQLTEAGLLLAITVLLTGVTAHRVLRRG